MNTLQVGIIFYMGMNSHKAISETPFGSASDIQYLLEQDYLVTVEQSDKNNQSYTLSEKGHDLLNTVMKSVELFDEVHQIKSDSVDLINKLKATTVEVLGSVRSNMSDVLHKMGDSLKK